MTDRLYSIEMGDAGGAPILLLHGFGGSVKNWASLQQRWAKDRTVVAFDLPGHGQSLNFSNAGEPKIAARAVIAEMEKRNIATAHIVGFSMGGAVAALIGLFAPERVASLTLLAPGGFGPEINHKLLQAYARADNEQAIRQVLPQFFGFSADISERYIEAELACRQITGMTESLCKIANLLFDGTKQGVIPIAPLLEITAPIKVLWGTQDNILPTRQAHKLPGLVATHVFPFTGHMLIEEQPDAVYRLVMQNTAHC